MQKVKVTKQFDDYVKGASMTSYAPDGGDKGDGSYEVADAVADRMTKAGVIEGAKASPSSGGLGGGAK